MGQPGADPDDFLAHFDGRLNAVARAHLLFARHPGRGIDLEELIAEELFTHAAACEDQFVIAGRPVQVDEQAGQAIGLAIHELATNAMKYGALCKPSGSVKVRWQIRREMGGRRLHLEWNERTVAVIDPLPKRVGFGREFLERVLARKLQATTRLEFRPGGLRFTVDLALSGANWPAEVP
jgi:two-component system CheB/CheR fusion protein